MTPTIEVSEVDRVPEDARVCDYDELTGDATHVLPNAVEHGTTTVRWRTAAEFTDIDVVRFTGYYQVLVTDLQDTPESHTTPVDDHERDSRLLVEQENPTPEDPLPESR